MVQKTFLAALIGLVGSCADLSAEGDARAGDDANGTAPAAEPELAPDDFVHPISPPHFSGSFGEYRRHSRYHHGLDYKTFTRVGLPVRMPRDGVVKRMKSSDVGYGNALWVASETGGMRFTFGHLQDFLGDRPGLEYFRTSLDLLLPKDSISFHIPPYFHLKRGEVLARSGESGSGAPHLHFEVLKNGWYYDPLHLPGMAVPDDTAPILQNVYLETGRTVLKFPVKLVPAEREPGDPSVTKSSDRMKARQDRYVLDEQDGAIRLPRGARVRFLIGAYDTMVATNRNGISDLRLSAGEGRLYARSLTRIRGTDLAGASRVYHTARTVIGNEYVYILYGGGRGTLDRGRADSDGVAGVKIQVADSMGNRAELNFQIRFEGDSIPAEYLSSAARDRGRFRSVGQGSSVSEKYYGAKLILNFKEGSTFGNGRLRMSGLPEAEVPRETSREVNAGGEESTRELDPFYERAGPAFIVETQDLFYRRGADGSAVFPAANEEGLSGLYYFNNTVKRWRLLARPYLTKDGKSYYSFRFRREGAIAQLVDRYPPRIGKRLLWDDPPLDDGQDNYVLEYAVFDRGSGIDTKRIEVLFDGRAYPHEWIRDRSIIQVVVPRGLIPSRGAVLSVRVVDHGENYSPWFFDCLDP